jgi:hypothetical protein
MGEVGVLSFNTDGIKIRTAGRRRKREEHALTPFALWGLAGSGPSPDHAPLSGVNVESDGGIHSLGPLEAPASSRAVSQAWHHGGHGWGGAGGSTGCGPAGLAGGESTGQEWQEGPGERCLLIFSY